MKKFIANFLNTCWDIVVYILESGETSTEKALNGKEAADRRQRELENQVLKGVES
ncbi:MAG: hypothetical protein V5A57_03400 [Candidatus Paceibacterota bacterium]